MTNCMCMYSMTYVNDTDCSQIITPMCYIVTENVLLSHDPWVFGKYCHLLVQTNCFWHVCQY